MSVEDETEDNTDTESGVSESQVTEESQGSDSQKTDYTEFEKKQYDRAKKAEAELKEAKAREKALKQELEKTKSIEANQQINAQINPDLIAKEVRLLATLTDEEISEARDIARGKGVSLEEALRTKSFLAFQKQVRDEEKKEKAKLGASKGSNQEEETDVFDTGVTPEGNAKHKELWKKSLGR